MDSSRRALTAEEERRLLWAMLWNGTARTLRELAGLSAQGLADRIGVDVEVVEAGEAGGLYPEQPYLVHRYVVVLRELCVTPPVCS